MSLHTCKWLIANCLANWKKVDIRMYRLWNVRCTCNPHKLDIQPTRFLVYECRWVYDLLRVALEPYGRVVLEHDLWDTPCIVLIHGNQMKSEQTHLDE